MCIPFVRIGCTFFLFIYVLTSINLKYLVNSIYFCTFASEIKNKKFNQLKVN